MSSQVPDPEQDLSTLYLRNRHLLVLTIVVFIIGGIGAVINLPRLEDPRITLRNASILTVWPGASAERIEAQVNEKIEDVLEEIDEIKDVESTARSEVSLIQIELNDRITDDTNEDVFAKIRSRLQNVQETLPENATIPVLDDNRGATAYTKIIGLSYEHGTPSSLNLLNRVSLDLKDRMLAIPNTELVRIFGGVNEEILVQPDRQALAALGLSAADLAQIIVAADSKISAGQLRGEQFDLRMEVAGGFTDLARIAAIPIQTDNNGTQIQLGGIATLTRSQQNPVDQMALADGKRMIYVAIRSDENVRVDTWSQSAQLVLDEFRNDYSDHIGMKVLFEQSIYTEQRLSELLNNMFAGAAIVVIIVLLLMGWKSALVVGSALPLSALAALFAFNFFDQSIHQMSIFGMIIAIGLLIDGAIVMTDDIRKKMQAGLGKLAAMQKTVRHLFIPLTASTFTTVLGFMPIFLLPGNAGDFVGPIAVSVILALVFSLFFALTVIPALATAGKQDSQQSPSWWRNGIAKPKFAESFRQLTISAARFPKTCAALSLLPCLAGFALMSTMDEEFFPAADRNMFEINIWNPPATAIAETAKTIEKAEQVLAQLPGLEETHWISGTSTPKVYYNQIPSNDNLGSYAHGIVTAASPARAKTMIREAQAQLDQALPEARVVVRAFAQGPPVVAPIIFRILGPDLSELRRLGEEVRQIMHSFPELTHSLASIDSGELKLWFNADEPTAAQLGLPLRNIAQQMQANLEGFTGGSVLEGVEELPVRVRYADDERSNLATIANIPLHSPTSASWIPATALGSLELQPEMNQVTRFNGQRSNNISGYLIPDAKAVSVSQAIQQRIEQQITFPDGYILKMAGDSEASAEATTGLVTFAPVLVTLMAATLILAFRSVAMAALVAMVGLMSIGLGMLSLKIGGYPLGFNPLIGSIGLAGVAINDTIVILSAILANEKAKLGDTQAIIAETYGCGRHLIATTLTTIGGFIPLLIFSGGSFWPPLAVVIVGGIGFTLIFLALFFTPLAYKAYANIVYKRQRHTAQLQPSSHGEVSL